MKSINFLLIIALLFIGNSAFAQSSKAAAKAVKKTEKLDSDIQSENPNLALNDSQKEQIVALHTQRMADIADFKKNNSNKEEIKAKSKELNKAMNAKIKTEILTPEQAEAQKAYRKKMKGQKGTKRKKGKKKKGAKSASVEG